MLICLYILHLLKSTIGLSRFILLKPIHLMLQIYDLVMSNSLKLYWGVF